MTELIPEPADSILQEFIKGITELKTDLISGIYLTGSLPLNDFHPNKSDIDFIILCREFPTGSFRKELEHLHGRINRQFKNPNLSGCYITPDGLNVHQAAITKTLCFHEGLMKESAFQMAPVTLYELKTTAVTLFGLPVANLPITVEKDDVNKFLFENINSYWKKWIRKHSSSHYLLLVLFPRLTEWVVLGEARQLCTLRTGKIASKTVAGYYCLEHLDESYHPIIQQAIEIRNEKRRHLITLRSSYYVQPSLRRARETIACARHINQIFNEEFKAGSN